ncbi:Mediator complex subunit Med4 [Penicillium verhagenii]|uniref:Mediator complex subunit Med4 n=1 Tax=Penicillium verhagenii TaxID=1562060 RepID=UPI0025459B07|nr:Mediator complex subunit Med4 [Penicillium verhagenii]KAJ5927780.1 Mediator complex subunit Med4 [Penicillium verhagenii]
METIVQSSLSEVESKLNALLTTLTTSPTAAGAPAAAVALLEADDNLSAAITTLRQHQENYARILQLRAEAERLEDRVKGIVRDVEEFDKEIRAACGDDDDDSDSELDSDDDDEATRKPSRKEIDYKLLLDFARRISKYNHEAAADAANSDSNPEKRQVSRPRILEKDVAMAGTNGEPAPDGAEPVSSVTKNATQWLDDSAHVTREVYMLPYPMEERIRMGLMAQVQLAAGDDPDKEVERLIREAEGLGAAEPPAPAPPVDTRQEEAANAAVQAASTVTAAVRAPAPGFAPAPRPKPSATLDLDLYDPDDDDM